MMLPIGMAILYREKEMGADISNFAPALMLCIAYSASIGGTGTLVGTPPNLLFVSTVEEIFPEAPLLVFTDWLKIGIPFVIIFLPIAWLYLVKYFKVDGDLKGSSDIIDKEYRDLGAMSEAEKKVTIIICIYAMGFIFRDWWSTTLGVQSFTKDSTVAFLASLFCSSYQMVKRIKKGGVRNYLSGKMPKKYPGALQ